MWYYNDGVRPMTDEENEATRRLVRAFNRTLVRVTLVDGEGAGSNKGKVWRFDWDSPDGGDAAVELGDLVTDDEGRLYEVGATLHELCPWGGEGLYKYHAVDRGLAMWGDYPNATRNAVTAKRIKGLRR